MIFTAKLVSKCSSFINQIKAISVFADTDFLSNLHKYGHYFYALGFLFSISLLKIKLIKNAFNYMCKA